MGPKKKLFKHNFVCVGAYFVFTAVVFTGFEFEALTRVHGSHGALRALGPPGFLRLKVPR